MSKVPNPYLKFNLEMPKMASKLTELMKTTGSLQTWVDEALNFEDGSKYDPVKMPSLEEVLQTFRISDHLRYQEMESFIDQLNRTQPSLKKDSLRLTARLSPFDVDNKEMTIAIYLNNKMIFRETEVLSDERLKHGPQTILNETVGHLMTRIIRSLMTAGIFHVAGPEIRANETSL